MTDEQLYRLWQGLDARDLLADELSGTVPPWAAVGVKMPEETWADFAVAVAYAEAEPEK